MAVDGAELQRALLFWQANHEYTRSVVSTAARHVGHSFFFWNHSVAQSRFGGVPGPAEEAPAPPDTATASQNNT